MTTYTDSGLGAGTYRYRVWAFNGEGLSLPSNLDAAAVGVIDYSGGFLPPGRIHLMANGGASYFDNRARLTPAVVDQAGSLFTLGRTSITRFTASFVFEIEPGTDPMADGMTFTIQGNSPAALGPSGGGLGYGPDQPGFGRGIRNSVAIKFDIYANVPPPEGEGDNSTGMFTGGRSPTIPEEGSNNILHRLDPAVIDLRSRHRFLVTMTYDGAVLSVTILDLETNGWVTHDYAVDIVQEVGGRTAYVGFTAGTGGMTAIHDVHAFRFEPE